MDTVALLSGGKDSCYNACHAVKQGHRIVALATLSPEEGKDELDSYLYQTVGQDGITFIAQALDLPLYRRVIQGSAVDQSLDYASHGRSSDDETEDLFQLLEQVLQHHPSVKAVSVGAILSNYQRTRVEHVCRRLNLTCLAYLWQRDQVELLDEMAAAGMECAVIKVAGAGLQVRHLGCNVFSPEMRSTLKRLNERFDLHPCGEGGEYETFTLDCPLFKKRLELTETEIVELSLDADPYSTVAYLRIRAVNLIDKADFGNLDTVAIPALLSPDAEELLGELPSSTTETTQSLDFFRLRESGPAGLIALDQDRFRVEGIAASSDGDVASDTQACFELLEYLLKENGLELAELCHINLYLNSMEDFAAANTVYASFFSTSPPTRACIGIPLANNRRLQLEVLGRRRPFDRTALHVQSRSYWAPANIGPYSQAASDGGKVYVAGQIGLIPPTLQIPSPTNLALEVVLSRQHFRRIMEAFLPSESKEIETAICWLVPSSWAAGQALARLVWDDATELEFRLARELPRGALIEWQIQLRVGAQSTDCNYSDMLPAPAGQAKRHSQLIERDFESALQSDTTRQMSLGGLESASLAETDHQSSSRPSSLGSNQDLFGPSLLRTSTAGTFRVLQAATCLKDQTDSLPTGSAKQPKVSERDQDSVEFDTLTEENESLDDGLTLDEQRRAARDASMNSGNSYIVVPDFKELSLSPSNEYRDRTLSLGARPQAASLALRSKDPSVQGEGRSFASTMRKTSGFFRRKFGTSSIGLGNSTTKIGSSAPSTPTGHGNFANEHVPPVPALPAVYSSNRPSTSRHAGPPVPPKNSVDVPRDARRRSVTMNGSLPTTSKNNTSSPKSLLSSSKSPFSSPTSHAPYSSTHPSLSELDWDKVLASLERTASLDRQKAEFSPKRRKRPSTSDTQQTVQGTTLTDQDPSDKEVLEPREDMMEAKTSPVINVLPSSSSNGRPSHDQSPKATPHSSPNPPPVPQNFPGPSDSSPGPSNFPAFASTSGQSLNTPTRSNPRHSVVGLMPNLASPASSFVAPSFNRSRSSLDEDFSSKDDMNEATLREKAQVAAEKCWNGDETFIKKHKVAEFLGSSGRLNKLAVEEYINKFDFRNKRLDAAFRALCEQLYLKAETQQVDRILEAFSRKYWRDNPDSTFGSADVVHAVVYSLLLLNTDLHIAELSSRMTSKQFVRNTMSAIRSQFPASSPTSSPPTTMKRPQTAPARRSVTLPLHSVDSSYGDPFAANPSASRSSLDRSNESSSRAKRSDSASSQASELHDLSGSFQQKILPVAPFAHKGWDTEMESALKDMYQEIKVHPVYQGLSSPSLAPDDNSTSANSLHTSRGSGDLARANSGRHSHMSMSGSDRNLASKRTSLRAPSPAFSVSTSFSERHSMSTGFGSSQTSASSPLTSSPMIGFAGSLSHTIIKEQQEDDQQSDGELDVTDEELALLGPPWAKEGILQRKRYYDAPLKKSKEKQWTQAFVVISKGELRMFQFGATSETKSSGGGVGGGNWLSNAQAVGELSLVHALAVAMPPPGFNNSRPHVFVLTLSNGSSWFFQAGTEDLVQEWVSTCNYWAARLSKEPLMGGVSNLDYGWRRVQSHLSPRAEDDTEDLASIRSGRSGKSHKSARSINSHTRPTSSYGSVGNINDKAHIAEWQPPLPPTAASTLTEESQMQALRAHVQKLQLDLAEHNDLRGPMSQLFSFRSNNANKATLNWERKSRYLLSEITKYSTYAGSLQTALSQRQSRSAEKAQEHFLKVAEESTQSLEAEPINPPARSSPERPFVGPKASYPPEVLPAVPSLASTPSSRPWSGDSFDTAPSRASHA